MFDKTIIEKWLAGEQNLEDSKPEELRILNAVDKELSKRRTQEVDIEYELKNFHEHRKPKAKQVSLIRRNWLSIAASFTILLVSYITWYSIRQQDVMVTAENGKTLQYVLPDSSIVVLNAGSSIAFESDSWQSLRKVNLIGEAYFEVRKGSSFQVHSNQGVVSVLGTKFNVRDRSGFFEVDCFEGKVEVMGLMQAFTRILESGDRIQVNQDVISRVSETTKGASAPTWLSGRISFQSVPVRQVLKELERQYDISIKWQQIDVEQKFTGSFTTNNLDVALQTISKSLNVTFNQVDEEMFLISSESP